MDPRLIALLLLSCTGLVRGYWHHGGMHGGGMGLAGYGGGMGLAGYGGGMGMGGYDGGLGLPGLGGLGFGSGYGYGGGYGFGGPSMSGYYAGPVWGRSGNAYVGPTSANAWTGGTAISVGGTALTGPGVGHMYARDIGSDTYIGSTMSAGGNMYWPSVGGYGYGGFGGGLGGYGGGGLGMGGFGGGLGGYGFGGGLGGYGFGGMGGYGFGMGGFRCYLIKGKRCPKKLFPIGKIFIKRKKYIRCCERKKPKKPY